MNFTIINIRTSTPFITGQPFSLFHNNNIFSRGTIGVAFTAESPNEFKNQFQIEHPSLSTIGDPLKITRYFYFRNLRTFK